MDILWKFFGHSSKFPKIPVFFLEKAPADVPLAFSLLESLTAVPPRATGVTQGLNFSAVCVGRFVEAVVRELHVPRVEGLQVLDDFGVERENHPALITRFWSFFTMKTRLSRAPCSKEETALSPAG